MNTSTLWLSSTSLVPTKNAILSFLMEESLIMFKVAFSSGKVDVKTVKQYAQPSNSRCVVGVFREYMRCISSSGRFYRRPLPSREAGEVRYGVQAVGINTLPKYLKLMCTEAKINVDGRRLTNHSGKVTCATRLMKVERLTNRRVCQELVTEALLFAPTREQAAHW